MDFQEVGCFTQVQQCNSSSRLAAFQWQHQQLRQQQQHHSSAGQILMRSATCELCHHLQKAHISDGLFSQCMHETGNEEPLKCKAMADDYLECLHHRKYVSSPLRHSTQYELCLSCYACFPSVEQQLSCCE
jgi:hypothetical protein